MACEAVVGQYDKRCGLPATRTKARRDPAIAFPWLEPQPVGWEGPDFKLCESHFRAAFAPATRVY